MKVKRQSFPLNDLRGFQRQTMGEWWAANGHVIQKQDKGTALLLAGNRNWNNYTVSVRVRLPKVLSEAEAGLLIHFEDTDDYLVFSVKERKGGPQAILRIVHKKPGMNIYGDESPVAGSLETWHELKADVRGVDVQGYVDGKPCVSYSFQGTPPPYNSHGKTWDPDLDHGWTGILAVDTPAEYADFRVRPLAANVQIVTPAARQVERAGQAASTSILCRYHEASSAIGWCRAAKLIYTDQAPASLRGEEPYLLANFVTSDNQLLGTGGEFAFNHALLISGAVQYFIFTGDQRYLELAKTTADWDIAHSTPGRLGMAQPGPKFC